MASRQCCWQGAKSGKSPRAEASHYLSMYIASFQSVCPPHGQWPAPMGSWRVYYFVRIRCKVQYAAVLSFRPDCSASCMKHSDKMCSKLYTLSLTKYFKTCAKPLHHGRLLLHFLALNQEDPWEKGPLGRIVLFVTMKSS